MTARLPEPTQSTTGGIAIFTSRLHRSRVAAVSMLFLSALPLIGCGMQPTTAQDEKPEPGAAAKGAKKGAKMEKGTNRLAQETSPYLLMHAKNPVDWYPWGPEALEKAKTENKLIFISIGYSSCHWCHVMEAKAFSNPEIAKYMNQHFVNIKIDREERPDLDDVFMTALTLYFQAVGSGQTGGWPMSMFLTPDGRPIGGGTYFPPFDDNGRMGFMTLLKTVTTKWRDDHDALDSSADKLASAVQAAVRVRPALRVIPLTEELVTPVIERLAGSFDTDHGGFGFDPRIEERPKFPVPTRLALLHYESTLHKNETAASMLKVTLDHMAAGGIYDHVGGGFHRYSTDRRWIVPHFEKMLYDNAQLAEVYAEAFKSTGEERYRQVAEGTLNFVLRELTDAGGGFYSALDADSNGAEGKFYVWSIPELAKVLTEEEADLVKSLYGVEGESPFEAGFVLNISRPLSEVGDEWKLTPAKLATHLARIHGKLLKAREQRPRPFCDDKILTAWNGLMIRSLARSGQLLNRKDYVQAAEKAAQFVVDNLFDGDRLLRTYREKQAKIPAYLDDYAFFVEGLLALHAVTNDARWANAARRLTDTQLTLFWDPQGKGCYFTSNDHEALLARTKPMSDSVLPSGNSVTVRNLIRLAKVADKPEYRAKAKQTLDLCAPLLETDPVTVTNMALALREYLDTEEAASPEKPKSPSKPADPAKPADPPESEKPQEKELPDDELDNGNPPTLEIGGLKKKGTMPEIVKADVYFSSDKLPAGGTAKVIILLRIEEKWHIRGNPSGSAEIEPTTIELKSKAGITLSTIKYPPGEKVVNALDEAEMIYSRQAIVSGQLAIPAAAGGTKDNLIINVNYQACTDKKCNPAATLSLKVPVEIAKSGVAVKPINKALFGKKTVE